jgi:methionyl-tRNA synthetase
MLMAHGDFVLPDNVPANEFLNLEGNKLSTSRNYAVWLEDYLKSFPVDSLRYVLANSLPEAKDTDFSWKEFQARHNNELADILGNFVNRTMTFVHKNFDGNVPEKSTPDQLDQELLNLLQATPEKVGNYLDTYQIRNAIKEVMDLARFANKYFNDKMPWKTVKTDRKACANTIALCLDTIRTLSVLMAPVLPVTSELISGMLNVPPASGADIWDDAGNPILKSGHTLNPPALLFQKFEDSDIQPEIDRLRQAAQPAVSDQDTAEAEGVKLIAYDDFAKLDLRVAEVISAEKVKKADKLLKLQIRIGADERQIIAGVAQYYSPEEMVGKRIIVVANLEPAKIRGEVSNGMLLAARDEANNLTLVTVAGDIASGSKVS